MIIRGKLPPQLLEIDILTIQNTKLSARSVKEGTANENLLKVNTKDAAKNTKHNISSI